MIDEARTNWHYAVTWYIYVDHIKGILKILGTSVLICTLTSRSNTSYFLASTLKITLKCNIAHRSLSNNQLVTILHIRDYSPSHNFQWHKYFYSANDKKMKHRS